MANPLKGEAPLGDYTLAFNFGAFCQLEQRAGMTMPQLLVTMAHGLGFGQLRDFVWAGLQTHHKDATDEAILALLDEHGYDASTAAVTAAVNSFFGKPKEKNPPKRG
jgi:hypothetical protein